MRKSTISKSTKKEECLPWMVYDVRSGSIQGEIPVDSV